ncbi:hypothetical protein AB0M28_17540 [Streptomyces sp. NPDC051940]|uniref:hypothetical protein n=1 Tax=Streptomyces sp. NPDC051940 TaxID=3155675 RepID=UPI00343DBF7D
MTQTPEPSDYVRGLPFGEELPVPEDSFVHWATFPFEGEFTVKRLTEPELPEPPRDGEAGSADCSTCRTPVEEALWADDHWRVDAIRTGLPSCLMLQPRAHHDLADLPPERAVELGPMIQRVERALHSLGGIARVHVNRWGDGGAHLHLWFLPRPQGLTQFRGTFLSLWEELIPQRTPDQLATANRQVAASLAKDGGTAYLV